LIQLDSYQLDAIDRLKNGSILVGGTGSGKSRTSLVYYYTKVCKGTLNISGNGIDTPMKEPKDLYIITTAKKRDTSEWLEECAPFRIGEERETSVNGVKVTIDSWNNIKKYKDVFGAVFIFDEQRVVGSGAWVKAFLNIARKNQWILLSATPGDTWTDYIPVFIANGFYRNKTDFNQHHVVFSRFSKYPKIDRFVDTKMLTKFRNDILVTMDYEKKTEKHRNIVPVDYDKELYLRIWRDRWDPYDDEPIAETGKLCYLMRKVVNSDVSRIERVNDILKDRPKVIIFYNYDYELDLLRELLDSKNYLYSEWNGQKHQDIPWGDAWAYLVQYNAGAEGWNCITTDTIIFFSQSYSYRMTIQAEGRVDRRNTPYKDLYYYILKSPAPIDIAIARALKLKKKFNESSFVRNQYS